LRNPITGIARPLLRPCRERPRHRAAEPGDEFTPSKAHLPLLVRRGRIAQPEPVVPQIKARLADLGGTVLPGSPADFGKLIADETEKWGKVIRAANIKPE
jgi:hypothetical protein